MSRQIRLQLAFLAEIFKFFYRIFLGFSGHLILFFNYRTSHICRPSAAAAHLLQSCLTPCNPMDCSPPGSSVPGIL